MSWYCTLTWYDVEYVPIPSDFTACYSYPTLTPSVSVSVAVVEIAKVHGDKKPVYTVQLIPGEQLVLVVSGKQRHVRLIPYLALEGTVCIYHPHSHVTARIISLSLRVTLTVYGLFVSGREVEGVKITDSKNCMYTCVGLIRQGSSSCLCVAVKRTVQIYELTRTRLRHRSVY